MGYNDDCINLLREYCIANLKRRTLKLKIIRTDSKLERFTETELKQAAQFLDEQGFFKIARKKDIPVKMIDFDHIQIVPK